MTSRRLAPSPHLPTALSAVKGQAMVELALIIPLLLMLAAGTMFVAYLCSQGIKVQQAANLAARIQGQERIAGGVNTSAIQGDNGVYTNASGQAVGSLDASQLSAPMTPAMLAQWQAQQTPPPPSSVFGEIQTAVKQFFAPSEQGNVFVQPPNFGQAGNTDSVQVVRVVSPPNVLGLNLNMITLTGTAYGGEDTRAYGLPRWGSTDAFGAGGEFWTQKDAQGNFTNLPQGTN